MKLTHPRIDTAFDDGINVLVAEEPRTFRQFCLDIFESFDGGEPFVLCDGNREVNLSKCGLLVENVLDFNVNDKKTGNALFNELANIAEEKFPKETADLSKAVSDYFEKLDCESSVQIDWCDESPVKVLFKAFGIAVKDDYDGYAEKLVNYLSALVHLTNIKFVAFINLKSYFSRNELAEIYKFLRYHGVFALLLESSAKEKIDGEFRVIIDNDLCEIIA